MGVCLIIRSGGGTDTSGATATAARVLSGYTCYVNDVKITGTMANQGTKTASLNAGGSYTIPAGYHSGSGKVTANALSGQTSATATAARILSGRTAWVNGSKLTGTMTNRGAISQKLAANGSYTVPAGWHNGSGKVTQSLTTQGAKNVTPKTTNQTACAASRWTTGNIVIVGASTLKAGNIKKGVKIFNVTGTWVGWVDNTMNCTNLSHFSISHDDRINQQVRLGSNKYTIVSQLDGLNATTANVNYIRENVIPYFSYIKVTMSAQVRQVSRAVGLVRIRAIYNWYPTTGNITDSETPIIDEVSITAGIPPSTTFNLSGSIYIEIEKGLDTTRPYIQFLQAHVVNATNGNIYATVKSVKFEFAKTNS